MWPRVRRKPSNEGYGTSPGAKPYARREHLLSASSGQPFIPFPIDRISYGSEYSSPSLFGCLQDACFVAPVAQTEGGASQYGWFVRPQPEESVALQYTFDVTTVLPPPSGYTYDVRSLSVQWDSGRPLEAAVLMAVLGDTSGDTPNASYLVLWRSTPTNGVNDWTQWASTLVPSPIPGFSAVDAAWLAPDRDGTDEFVAYCGNFSVSASPGATLLKQAYALTLYSVPNNGTGAYTAPLLMQNLNISNVVEARIPPSPDYVLAVDREFISSWQVPRVGRRITFTSTSLGIWDTPSQPESYAVYRYQTEIWSDLAFIPPPYSRPAVSGTSVSVIGVGLGVSLALAVAVVVMQRTSEALPTGKDIALQGKAPTARATVTTKLTAGIAAGARSGYGAV